MLSGSTHIRFSKHQVVAAAVLCMAPAAIMAQSAGHDAQAYRHSRAVDASEGLCGAVGGARCGRQEPGSALRTRRDAETVNGATLTVDFGTPAKRGRQIWGMLVPFGKVWRTGANRATHLMTDRDLVLGSGPDTLAVPAGQYTLFSIPDREGGVLIVSKETDITGTAYDPAHDLGRVRLVRRRIEEPVEIFNIAVTPEPQGGALRLQWDETELVVPFTVRGKD